MIPVGSFVAVTVPLVLTPGASTAVVLRNSLAGGVRAGLVTAVGVNSGSLGYGLLTAFGFAVALQRWPRAWLVLRVAGVGYLAWLGVMSLWRARSPAAAGQQSGTAGPSSAPKDGEPMTTGGSWKNLYEGFATNALNPAIATFYLVLLPQFIPRGAAIVPSTLLLTAVHVALAASWHTVWACAGGTLARVLAGGRPRQALDAMTGGALIALAARMALR